MHHKKIKNGIVDLRFTNKHVCDTHNHVIVFLDKCKSFGTAHQDLHTGFHTHFIKLEVSHYKPHSF